MKKLFLILFWVPFTVHAQENTLAEINEQVWVPFIKAYATSDGELLASLHTDDAVRVRQEASAVDSGASFVKSRIDNMARAKAEGRFYDIDFRFKERHHNANAGFEIGYYKTVANPNPANYPASYGEFTVLLRKMDGRWRITLDADKGSTEKEFMAGTPMNEEINQ